MIFQLLYLSKSVHPRGDLSDIDILRTATVENKKHGITGALIRDSRRFLQLLEGNESHVRQLVEKIKQDPRHFDLRILTTRSVQDRVFGKWAMGYSEIEPGSFDQFTRMRLSDQVTLEAALADLYPMIQQPSV